MYRFRDKEIAKKVISKLKKMDLDIKIMHVCGTHQDTLVRYGIEQMLKNVGVKICQGPGCPVCVTTPKEIEECIALAKKGKSITVFGDMVKVPSESGTLWYMHSKGLDINIVYGIDDAVKFARKTNKETVFMGIGFETTIPSTASTILNSPPKNFSILCCHRTIPNALKALVSMGEVKLNGLIEPGHVSTIIGVKPYEFLSKEYNIPQVIAGFEPLDLLMAVFMLAKQIEKNEAKVENEYRRVVKYEGNITAQNMIKEVFLECDVQWRGFPIIEKSGLEIKKEFEEYDARKKFEDDLKVLEGKEFKEHPGCKCGEVLRGVISSDECPLFGKVCNPNNPLGPCMVSAEGSCNIVYKHGK